MIWITVKEEGQTVEVLEGLAETGARRRFLYLLTDHRRCQPTHTFGSEDLQNE